MNNHFRGEPPTDEVWRQPSILLLSGIQAAGKSTVAQRVAERLPRSVHVRGDLFRRMVVNGRAEMSASPSPEALAQLRLRYRLAAATADAYFEAGFTVVVQDVVLGEHLAETVRDVRNRPLMVVVLAPSVEAVAERERVRGKVAYDQWAVTELDASLRERTPRLGLWLDTSRQGPDDTVEEILRRAPSQATV